MDYKDDRQVGKGLTHFFAGLIISTTLTKLLKSYRSDGEGQFSLSFWVYPSYTKQRGSQPLN